MKNGCERRRTNEQRVFIVKTFYKTKNKSETCRRFREHFNQSLKRDTVAGIINRFEATGSVADLPRPGRPRSITTEENKKIVEATVICNPGKSTRTVEQELGISRRSIRRMLTELDIKPYNNDPVYIIPNDDCNRRIQFCEIFKQKCAEDPSFPEKIIWSGEATFKLNGLVDQHNNLYWSSINPCETIVNDGNSAGVTVWIGICASGLVGPFFFEEIVTGESYVDLLKKQVLPTIATWPDIDEMWFQHDATPPHFSVAACNWLNEHFPQRWIGQDGQIEFPAQSPDLAPPDFFLWGLLKNTVYTHNPKTIEQLTQCIVDSCVQIHGDLIREVCYSVKTRVGKCIEANGQNFEAML